MPVISAYIVEPARGKQQRLVFFVRCAKCEKDGPQSSSRAIAITRATEQAGFVFKVSETAAPSDFYCSTACKDAD